MRHWFCINSVYKLKAENTERPKTHSVCDNNLGKCFFLLTAEKNETGPLCTMISTNRNDPANQHYRICMAVCTSSNFRYAQHAPQACRKEILSFRNTDVINHHLLVGQSYYERMTICSCKHFSHNVVVDDVYISRAYKSNQVFVYRRDPANKKLFLDNLSTNISIVD